MNLRKLEDLDIEGKKVLLRLDLNVPQQGGLISDSTRLDAALPTIKYISERAKVTVICSHYGRPKGRKDPKYSLEFIGSEIASRIDKEVVFVEDYLSEPLDQIFPQVTGKVILLENLRFHPQEKENDRDFARILAAPFDCYVNDAFGTAHRKHASVHAVPEVFNPEDRAAGFLIQKEVETLSNLFKSPKSPFTVVMGGAKVSDKINVILSLMKSCNTLLIGGAMAYTFLKFRGIPVGDSRVESDCMDIVEKIYKNAEAKSVRIEIPVDHVCAAEFSENAEPVFTDEISNGLMGLDIGKKTRDTYARIIESSGTVLWNGPMGVFEWENFSKGSMTVAHAMADSTANTVVGGGDSVSAIKKAGCENKVDHISTGGGASLEFLEGKVLPGLQVLLK